MFAYLQASATRADNRDSYQLSWRAPKGCPSSQEVTQSVAQWLGQAVKPYELRGIRVEAKVEPAPIGYALDLVFISPSGGGREQLEAEKCTTLADVVALKIALVADPSGLLSALDELPKKSLGYWSTRLAAGVGPGVLPSLGPMFELSASRQFEYVSVEIGVGYGAPNTELYPALKDGAKIDLIYALPRVCALANLGPLVFPLCAGLDVGVMRGEGSGPHVSQVFTSHQAYGAVAIGAAVRWPKTGLIGGWCGFEALMPVVRPEFNLRNLGPLYSPDPIGARVALGLELRFGTTDSS